MSVVVDPEQGPDHDPDLGFFGLAVSGYGFFYFQGGIFEEGESRPGHGHQHGPADLAEGDGRFDIQAEKRIFDCDFVGGVSGDEALDPVLDFQETVGEGGFARGLDRPVGEDEGIVALSDSRMP